MILKEFSEFFHKNKDNKPIKTLFLWIRNILEKEPETLVEKIIHAEIYIAKNKKGDFLLIGKSNTGRKLIENLYSFTLSLEQQEFSRWIHNKKPTDFS